MRQAMASVCMGRGSMRSDKQSQSLAMQSPFSRILAHPLMLPVGNGCVWSFVLCILKGTEEKRNRKIMGEIQTNSS